LVLLKLLYRHKSMCGDAPGLISTANVIIPQSHSAQAGTIHCGQEVPSTPTSHKRLVLRSHIIAWTNDCHVCGANFHSTRTRHYPASIREMNLVKNNTLVRIVVLSIWLCYCFIKSAAAVYASITSLSVSLFNWDVSPSYPAKGYQDWKFWRYLGQLLSRLITRKLPSSTHHWLFQVT